MIKVKVFVYGRRQQQQRRGYDNSSPDFRHGELKINKIHLSSMFNKHKTLTTISFYIILFKFLSWVDFPFQSISCKSMLFSYRLFAEKD